MLAVLALDGPTARDTLAALLWPEVPLKTANVSLRQRVFRLRRRTGNDLMRTGDVLALAEDIAIDGLRDWQEYIDDIGRLLQAPPTRAPTIGIAVTSTDAGGHCH